MIGVGQMKLDVAISQDSVDTTVAFVDILLGRIETLRHSYENTANIGAQELTILNQLAANGSLRVKDIVEQLVSVSPSTLTRILDRLEAAKLVRRTLNPEDRRSFHVTLTSQGQAIAKDYAAELEAIVRHMLLPLTPAERMMLAEWQIEMASALATPDTDSTDGSKPR